MKHYPTNAHYNAHLRRICIAQIVGLTLMTGLVIAADYYGWLDPFKRLMGFDA